VERIRHVERRERLGAGAVPGTINIPLNKSFTTWAGWLLSYDHPFYLILNVAVGGKWPGNPDTSTKFPQQMLVDFVRVYSRK